GSVEPQHTNERSVCAFEVLHLYAGVSADGVLETEVDALCGPNVGRVDSASSEFHRILSDRRRKPFRTTSTVPPSCPITASGNGESKNRLPVTSTSMALIATIRFCRIITAV